MIQMKTKYFIAVNAGLCLLGMLGVSYGIQIKDALNTPLLEAIGTGLIAAGLVNILDRAMTIEPITIESKQRIEVVAEQRVGTPWEILNLKYTADKVDLVGVNLNYYLEELVNDSKQQLINRLIYNKLQLRMFLMHPESPYLLQRAIEDGIDPDDLIKRQKQSVTLCVKFYEQLCERYNSATKAPHFDFHNTGFLQIKLLSFCPYMTIYRINDNVIYWGLYTSNQAGIELPLFMTTQDRDWRLYKYLHEHIHGLIERDRAYPDLVSMPKMGAPTINNVLLRSII